jgi:c-di-AMP phosphodiesterase-like protein
MNAQNNKIKKQAKMEKVSSGVVTLDNVDYKIGELSNNAKTQLSNIQFVDRQIRQLQNEWAVSDTARLGYQAALKGELAKSGKK